MDNEGIFISLTLLAVLLGSVWLVYRVARFWVRQVRKSREVYARMTGDSRYAR